MNSAHSSADRFVALDPAHSVAVEACAGSGKTWLLTARLLRLLLADVRPGDILAITYTRKAAREIESRLRGLLARLATANDDEVAAILSERGVDVAEIQTLLPRARQLYESVLQADPPMTVTTFHGWFARLLGGAPLDSELAGRTLDESSAQMLDEAWVLLAGECSREPDGELAGSLLWLYGEIGAFMTRALVRSFVERRAEWRVWLAHCGGDAGIASWLDDTFQTGLAPFDELFQSGRLDELAEFATLLGRNASTDQTLGDVLAQAVVDLRGGTGDAETAFEAVRAAFLTQNDTPKARKASGAQGKRLTVAGEARFLALHVQWSERLIAVIGILQDQRNAQFNRHALRVGRGLLAKLEQIKQQHRAMDFTDLEAAVDALLASEGTAAYIQARLDARYRHILLDEFQDTNPLQWRILRGWLDAYAGAGLERPSIFLVGDPKQSIYRFRRAEPLLFAAALQYLEQEFGALYISNAHTYRNAGGVKTLVNAVFAGEPEFEGFVEQTSEREEWPAHIEVMPLIPAPDRQNQEMAVTSMRNPLMTPRVDVEDQRRKQEAQQLAQQIMEMVGSWQVSDAKGGWRPARYSDVMILTRRKTPLSVYETALRDAGIPFESPGRGGLLDTLEARDLKAVLGFLAAPGDNLALAHLLRTPAFGVSDTVLLELSAQEDAPWWSTLQQIAADSEDASLGRAVRLLEGWLDAAAYLPAHDLLDRIMHESDWLARCRAAIPEARWPAVHSNLESLLELALNVDGGRYPSLTRFVDELQRLSASDDEAPDEGLIATGEGLGRVRIMTIHGAKGLEAPIVWLIDANAQTRNTEGYGVALDWPPSELEPQHFSLLGRISEAGPSRRTILTHEAAAARREELNLLYVAITRAEQVFIASGVEQSGTGDAITPWQRLSNAMTQLADNKVRWVEIAKVPHVSRVASGLPERRAADEQGGCRAPVSVGQKRFRQDVAEVSAGSAGQTFGTAMHAWLEAEVSGWPRPAVPAEVEQAARRILARPTLRRFFDASLYQRAGSETSFVSADGQVGRIDRWVDTGEAIWVLDYKSGHVPDVALLEVYRQQVTAYREGLRAVFPGREIRGLLIFTDGGEVEVA